MSMRLSARTLAAATLAALLAGCAPEALRLPAGYEGPPPLPADLAGRFAYVPQKIEPTLTTIAEDETSVRTLGTFEAPCPVTGGATVVTFEFFRSKVPPADGAARRPLILMVPILAGKYPEIDHLGALFTRNGLDAFFVHRPDDLLAFQNEPADLEAIMRRSVVNTRRTLDWAAAQADVDPQRIGLCGISLGAIVGSVFCAVEPRVRRSVLIMGGADLAQVFWESRETPVLRWRVEHRRRWGTEDLDAFRTEFAKGFFSDPGVYAPYVDARTVLQFVARLDNKVPAPCQWKLWKALGEPNGWSIPIGHYTAILYLGFAEEKAMAFYREGFGLKQGPEVASRK